MRARWTILAGMVLVAAACGGETSADDTTTSAPTTATTPTTEPPTEPTLPADGFPSGESALDNMAAESFPEPLVPPEEILSGGPPPDGIPPIDSPVFVSVDEADAWLDDSEAVVTLDLDGEARAYPIQVMTWHEIVNDTVSGTPVSVTYCPLCNTAVSFVREIDGEETTFGTSGRLFASALVMYDRATESLWTHFDGRAVVGVLTGHRLDPIPSPLLAWSEFKAAYPDGLVLDRDATGHSRPYGTNPYAGYDNPESRPFLFRGEVDERSRAMQRVVGVQIDEAARAWSLDAVTGEEAQATNTELGSTDLVIFWKAGQASALESDAVGGGRDIGSVGVFSPVVDSEPLTFSVENGLFVDEETRSTWDITGRAIDGPAEGTQLERLHHFDTFWFAWSTYAPGTDLVEP